MQVALGTYISTKWSDFAQLVKLRLSLLVVFASVIAFAFASPVIIWPKLLMLALGGFLITGASAAINEILEKDYDKKMSRTANRPLPTGRMTVFEATLISGIMAVLGLAILAFSFNPLAAVLGAISLFSYAFIYTPMKRVSSIAVFIGAIPGAMPPLIGYVACTGVIDSTGLLLFGIQFLWQFPHFWAIAWLSHDEYKNAGFHLLPSSGGKDKQSTIHIAIYTFVLTIASALPLFYGIVGIVGGSIMIITGLLFFALSLNLFRKQSDKTARQLMFGSFFYLPIVLISFLIG